MHKRMASYLFFSAIFMAVVFACAGFNEVYKPPETPVCLKPEYKDSVICAIGNYLKLQPEQMNDIIIDSALLGIGTKIIDGPSLKKSSAKIRKWVVEKDILTMEGLVNYTMKEADLNPAFAMLLQRRLPAFGSVPTLSIKPFQPIDKSMVVWELDQLDGYLKWF